MTKTAVVLFNLGGPSCRKEVLPFLFRLFSDPAILTLPTPLRFLLAHFISRSRVREAIHIYAQLGGGSPLLKNTQKQAKALESVLGKNYRVFIAMRYAAPFVRETFEEVKAYGPDEIILLPLYPHYSTTTTESSFKAWKESVQGWKGTTRMISSYPTLEGFIEALKQLILPHYQEAQKQGTPRLLLTAHGLPEKIIKRGDPYQTHVEETARALLKKLPFSPLEPVLCYQSRVGPLKWTAPYTDQEIIRASQERRPLVIVPLSFVSEHAETLVELDMTYRNLALAHGCPSYHRVETVQTHPSFIKGLASLVKGDTLSEPI